MERIISLQGSKKISAPPKNDWYPKTVDPRRFDSHNWLLHSVCLSRAISVRSLMYYIAWKTPSSVLLCGNKSRAYNFLLMEEQAAAGTEDNHDALWLLLRKTTI